MKLIHALALSAGIAGAALFAGPTQAATQTNQTTSLRDLGADAKTYYSDADVGVARRAFRAQCATTEDAGVCDCLAAGYSQSLTPAGSKPRESDAVAQGDDEVEGDEFVLDAGSAGSSARAC